MRHHDIRRAHFQGTAQRLVCVRLPAEDRQTLWEENIGRLVKSMFGTWQLDYVNLLCGDSGGYRRGEHKAALFHKHRMDGMIAVRGVKHMGTLGFDTGWNLTCVMHPTSSKSLGATQQRSL